MVSQETRRTAPEFSFCHLLALWSGSPHHVTKISSFWGYITQQDSCSLGLKFQWCPSHNEDIKRSGLQQGWWLKRGSVLTSHGAICSSWFSHAPFMLSLYSGITRHSYCSSPLQTIPINHVITFQRTGAPPEEHNRASPEYSKSNSHSIISTIIQ